MKTDQTTYHLGGSLRARTAEDTLAIISPFIEQSNITRIANITGLDILGVPVYTCIRPLAKSLSTSQGKGISHSQAKCSAYMEAIEHYFAEQVRPDFKCRCSDSTDTHLLDLTLFQRGSCTLDTLNDQTISWSKAVNLLDQKIYAVPTAMVSLDLTSPNRERSLFRTSSSGLASGNNAIEACYHGILECIERHVVHNFYQLSKSIKETLSINLATITHLSTTKLLSTLSNTNLDCLLYELPNEFDVPTYFCVIADNNPINNLGHYCGSGSHLDSEIAVCRAITEAIQSRLTYIAGSRDDLYSTCYAKTWKPLQTLGSKVYAVPAPPLCTSLAQHLTTLQQRICNRNYQYILKITHTPMQSPICVNRILIPGLKV